MASNADYIGRYGETLRKLSGASQPAPALPNMGTPQPNMGGALQPSSPTAGAFGAGSGPVLPQAIGAADAPQSPGAFAPPQQQGPSRPAPAVAAFEQAEAPPKDDRPAKGLNDVLGEASPEDLDQAATKLEESGVPVDAKYAELVETGKIPAKDKPDRREKGIRLVEFGLRMMAASAQGMDAFGAAGVAGLGVMEGIQLRKEKAEAKAEKDRLEKKGDEKEAEKERTRKAERNEDKTEIRDVRNEDRAVRDKERLADAEQKRLDREARLAEAKLREDTDRKVPKKTMTDEEGNVFMVDDEGVATPVTTKVKETRRGKRGGKTWEVEVDKQLRAATKDGTAIDRDTVMRAVGDRVKAMKADGKLVRQLTREGITDIEAEISRRATRQVLDEYGSIGGSTPGGSSPGGGNIVDFNSL